jgi:hypothetical protein
MKAKTPEPVGPPPPRRSCVLDIALGGALLLALAISCSTSSDRKTTFGQSPSNALIISNNSAMPSSAPAHTSMPEPPVKSASSDRKTTFGQSPSNAMIFNNKPAMPRYDKSAIPRHDGTHISMPEPPVKCVDFTMRNGWLSSYPSLAARQAPWGHYFATYLAQALWRLDREAHTARRFDDTNRPPNLRALELVCLGELLAVQPNPGGTNASQCELRLEYELKSTRRTPAVLLEKREVAVAGGNETDFDESSLHQLLKLGAERVAENVNRTLPSMINGTR